MNEPRGYGRGYAVQTSQPAAPERQGFLGRVMSDVSRSANRMFNNNAGRGRGVIPISSLATPADDWLNQERARSEASRAAAQQTLNTTAQNNTYEPKTTPFPGDAMKQANADRTVGVPTMPSINYDLRSAQQQEAAQQRNTEMRQALTPEQQALAGMPVASSIARAATESRPASPSAQSQMAQTGYNNGLAAMQARQVMANDWAGALQGRMASTQNAAGNSTSSGRGYAGSSPYLSYGVRG